MKTFYTPAHLVHAPSFEFEAGRLSPAVEVPERAERVRARIEARKLGPILAPGEFGNEPALRVHDPAFVQFLGEPIGEWRGLYPGDTARCLSLRLAGARAARPAATATSKPSSAPMPSIRRRRSPRAAGRRRTRP